MDLSLHRLAESQHGIVTTAQATTLGWSPKDLSRSVRSGSLVHLAGGLYAVPSPDLRTSVGRHRALCRGALLLYPDAVLSHASAVVSHDLPIFGMSLTRAFLLRPLGGEVLTQSLVLRPLSDLRGDETALGPAVDVAPALIQHTLDNGLAPGLVATDAALHRGVIEMAQLLDAAAAVRGWPRSGRVTSLLSFVDGRSESVGESRLRLDLALAGIPVVPQVVIREPSGAFVARVDLLVRGSKVVIEFDGLVKYREDGADALVAEKRREDRLRRLGYLVVRVTWADLARPAQVLAWVRDAMRTDLRASSPPAA